MLNLEEAQKRAEQLVEMARAIGSDAADAIYVCDASTQVQMRLGVLEDVERSEGEEIGLRVFSGRRSATVSSSDMSAEALSKLAERALAMAREAPEDEYAGLAPEELLLRKKVNGLDLADAEDPQPEALKERALMAEEAARGVMGVTNSEGAGAGAGRSHIALATSHGFSGSYAGTSHSCYASVLAGVGSAMQRDYASHSVRHLSDLEQADGIGHRAGQRAVARLNPIKVESGQMPVIFDPRVGSSLIGHLIGGMTGSAIARKSSFLLECLGKRIFRQDINIIDDPLRPRGLRSRPFDGEGLPTSRSSLIDEGVLTGWLLDSASARQLGLRPTGHASRGISGAPGAGASNLHLEPGSMSPGELMADVKRGIYVTELIGMGVNMVTGDYSRGASGFLIENGATGPAVAEITIAGNLLDIFAELTAANDLEFRYGVNVPTLRIDGMMVAGG